MPPPPPLPRPIDHLDPSSKPTPVASKRASLRSQYTVASTTQRPNNNNTTTTTATDSDAWPVHPIPALRGPFDESIAEAMDPDVRIRRTLDAAARRLQLLELDDFSEEYSTRWRVKPGAKFHPLWKLIAQISFGIHLLHQHTAKSEEEVIRILQTHIDEVDGFLEDTHADFDLAIKDILERARLLQLSLDHGRTFGRMLRKPEFRNSVLHGNEIIERIVQRTSRALNSLMEDVQKGTEATAEFAKYLDRVKAEWTANNEDMNGVYEAMRGNAEGWYCCFEEVNEKATALRQNMHWLRALVKEVTRRSGIAERTALRENMQRARSQESVAAKARQDSTRLHRVQSSQQQQGPLSPTMSMRSKRSLRMSMSKPLPPDPNRRSYTPGPIDPPPHRSDIRVQQTYPEQTGLSRATSASNSIQHSRRPSQTENYQRHSRQLDSARSPAPRSQPSPAPYHQTPVASRAQPSPAQLSQPSPALTDRPHLSPAQVSPLTPGQMAQLHELQELQHRSQQQFNAQAAQILGWSPTDTPLTPDKFLRMLEVANSTRGSQMPPDALQAAPMGSPLTPNQLLQQLFAPTEQTASPQDASHRRSRSSMQRRERDILMSQMHEDIPVNLDDIAEEGSLHSPLPDNMLIPVLPDIRESDSLHLGDILIGAPSNTDIAREKSSADGELREQEEKQVMSNETFLMLDDTEEEHSKRAQKLGEIAELDNKKRSMINPKDVMPSSPDDPNLPLFAKTSLVQPDADIPAELDVRKTMNGMDGKSVLVHDSTLSRQSTKKSTRSNGSGHRSRPHSSYSVLDAYRKSKGLSTGSGGGPLQGGEEEEQPPMPTVPSIAYLATEATTPKTPLVHEPEEKPLEPVKTRNSSDSAVPQLTKSGSTTSVSSATHRAAAEASDEEPSTNTKPGLTLMLEEDARQGKRASSPVGPAIVDDGLLELVRPSAKPSPTEAVQMTRSKSVHPTLQSPRATDPAFPTSEKLTSLFRSNSSKSHKRNSKVSLPSAYSKQVSPSFISPNSVVPSLAASPALPQHANTLVSPIGTVIGASVSPALADSPVLKEPLEAPPKPPYSRHDSWMSEKVVVVGPASSDELALLRQSRQAPRPRQSQHPAFQRSEPSEQPRSGEQLPTQQQRNEDSSEQAKLGHAHRTSRGLNRKAAPSPLIMAPPHMIVEADDGTPRSQHMITTFTPLSLQKPPERPTGMRPRPATSYSSKPRAPPSPSLMSNMSKEALPQMQPTTPGIKAKRFGTLRRPVNAVRGLFKKQHNAQ